MIDRSMLLSLRARLEAGDPLRVVVGEHLYPVTELHLGPAYEKRLRAMILDEIAEDLSGRSGESPASQSSSVDGSIPPSQDIAT